MSDFIFLTGKRANGQRAQPVEFENFKAAHNEDIGR
jgi:hypothetical protein